MEDSGAKRSVLRDEYGIAHRKHVQDKVQHLLQCSSLHPLFIPLVSVISAGSSA